MNFDINSLFKNNYSDIQFFNNSIKIENGVFGTNIHPSGQYGADNPKKKIDNWSAGCQVFRSYDDYLWMMQTVRNQIDKTKYKSFTYTLLNIKDL